MKEPGRSRAALSRLNVVRWAFAFLKQPVGEQAIQRAVQLPGQHTFPIGVRQSLNQGPAVGAAVGQSQQEAVRQVFERQEVECVAFHAGYITHTM